MDIAAQQLLDAIEQAEMRSLTWGYVDGSLSRSDVLQLARALPAVVKSGLSEDDCEDLAEELLERQLIFERRGRLRSRFAETVRLMVRSRQIFRADQWRSSPHLVADFRIDRRPRTFPRRDVQPSATWAQMPPDVQQDGFRRRVWETLTRDENGQALPLARFQAASAVRLLADSGPDSATIVTAGTGSGKTFCFYLPALTEMAARVAAGSSHTLALALYPRVELLKDQLREAVRLASRVTPLLLERGGRPLRIGVYYGDAPGNWAQFGSSFAPKNWKRLGRGYICPFMRCLKCNGSLVWNEDDALQDRERLKCAAGRCDGEVSNVVLTRDTLKASGCDLLFITTESLNARMTERQLRPVLGLDRPANQRPSFVLLDEVHTYAGAPGAQVALTLSRWRNALGGAAAGIRWIGLSATLRDADQFFAAMTGVPAASVVTIAPAAGDCFEQGCDYQIVLRGDPSGQTSVLSATIQTVMLIGRMAESENNRTDGVFGRKTFIFTDDIDVNNRLYHNLADAEAYRVRNNRLVPDGRRDPLAKLREDGPDALERDLDGQRWWAAEEIAQYSLSRSLPLGRTTSQDSGVDVNATVVVATASLEVGFNDTSVGFVIQHKAPRSAAGFLQRKGRAGRSQTMRPWMITVLSDYGRDRAAFASYEQLFDPALTTLNLPTSNLYVLRIQATFALLEWLYLRWDNKPPYAYLWSVVSGPKGQVQHRRAVAGVLRALLSNNDPSLRLGLAAHLVRALRLAEDRVEVILWQSPRGLMLEVIPTLLRRLYTDWRLAFPSLPNDTEAFERTPLPEFLPSRLFSELQLPEIQVVPVQGVEEGMPVGTALNMVVPGRVSRRFSPFDSDVSHWLPIETDADRTCVELSTHVPIYDRVDIGEAELVVIRPRQMRLDKAPDEVLPTSNARWQWTSAIRGGEAPVHLAAPHRGPWAPLLRGMEAHTYNRRSPVRVQRYAREGEANLRLKVGASILERKVCFEVHFQGQPAAVGLEQDVDGLRIVVRLPEESALALRHDWPSDVQAACRTMLFRESVSRDVRLAGLANPFQLDWLAQVFLAAAVTAADANGWGFAISCVRVTVSELEDAVAILFPVGETPNDVASPGDDGDEDDAEDEPSADTPRAEQKLVRKLRALLHDAALIAALRELAGAAIQPDPVVWGGWLRKLLCETLASAMSEAATQVLPHNNAADTLLSDWLWSNDSSELTIWLTEQTLGGAGVAEELATLCTSEPRKLLRATEAALAPTDLERASEAMRALCERIRDDGAFALVAEQCAEALSHAQRTTGLEALAAELRRSGHAVGRTFGVSANARLLRSGMRQSTWSLLADLDQHRMVLQARLGVVVDLRVFCRIAVVNPQYGTRLRTELMRMRGAPVRGGEDAQILSGMLWPQPVELRATRRPAWHPYRAVGPTEPGLMRALLVDSGSVTLDVADVHWRDQMAQALSRHGIARLSARDVDRATLGDAITWFASTPIDVGWLHLHAAVERIEASEGRVTAVFELRELG